MDLLNSIASIGVILSAILFTIGIIRPGFVIWWNEANSRKQVFMVWGGLLVVFAVLFFISSNRNDPLKENNTAEDIETHSQD